MIEESALDAARDLIAFIDASPTPYHAVAEVARRLGAAGFVELDAREEWSLRPGTKAYVVQGGGTIIAFIAGSKAPADAGFLVLGAHTDSPNLRVKPVSDIRSAGHRQLAVEVYGGVLLSTWLDRDLGIAGRVSLADGSSRLLRFENPICRISMLAIHLDREVNTRGLILNPQSQLNPTWSLELDTKRHCFVDVLCQELGRHGDRIDPEAVIAYDLCLFDCQPPALGGAYGELIFSARLDNLASCHAATRALVESETTTEMTRVLALYDHEEVGSQSASGARSLLLSNTLERIATSYPEATAQTAARAFARSLFVSCDMAHAVNPNYVDRHDKQHRPKLAHGPVIKSNVNQAYATDAPGAALFAAACREVGAPAQYFVSRNDMGCGSTIGPISAARTGIRTVDVGNPMLSMHSCREVAAVQDVAPMIGVLKRMLSESRPPPPKV